MWFVFDCRACQKNLAQASGPLAVSELNKAVSYWVSVSQSAHFATELGALRSGNSASLLKSSPLISFLDEVGQNSRLTYDRQHPIILHGKHPVSKLLIHMEHVHLLHAGPLLVSASLGRRFYIMGGRRVIRSSRAVVSFAAASLYDPADTSGPKNWV